MATPLRTVRHRTPAEALRAVLEVVQEVGAEEIVIGLPLRLDGGEGEAARRIRRFAEALEAKVALPIILWDERLSTVAADRALTEQGVRGKARRDVVDQAAATLMLQSYLDAQESRSWEANDDPPMFQPEPHPSRPRGRKNRRGRGDG